MSLCRKEELTRKDPKLPDVIYIQKDPKLQDRTVGNLPQVYKLYQGEEIWEHRGRTKPYWVKAHTPQVRGSGSTWRVNNL